MNQRKASLLGQVKHESWETVAARVVNLQGEHPCWGTVRNIVSEFNVSKGHRQYHQEKLQGKVERSVTFAEKKPRTIRTPQVALESSYRRCNELLNDESTTTPHRRLFEQP